MPSYNTPRPTNWTEANDANRKQEKLELLSMLVGGFDHDFSNGNGAVNNRCRVYEEGEAEYERADNAQQVVGSFPMHETSGGTSMAMNRHNGDQITEVTFQATSIRESYTLNDVHQALLQGTGEEDCKMDPSFVDFVMGGLIKDELDMYDRKRTEMKEMK